MFRLSGLCFLLTIEMFSCSVARQQHAVPVIETFRGIITGDFDNAAQVEEERKAGKQVHPFARHVNRVANDKIAGLPAGFSGFFLLEESYYEYPGKPVDIKPYLFLFEPIGDTGVRLKVFQIPDSLDRRTVVNSNTGLRFDYATLRPSATFKGAEYVKRDRAFFTESVHELPGGMRFTLREKLEPGRLEVMELLEKNGVRLTPYDTPIIYLRKNRR